LALKLLATGFSPQTPSQSRRRISPDVARRDAAKIKAFLGRLCVSKKMLEERNSRRADWRELLTLLNTPQVHIQSVHRNPDFPQREQKRNEALSRGLSFVNRADERLDKVLTELLQWEGTAFTAS
jgi:hypothetical protein